MAPSPDRSRRDGQTGRRNGSSFTVAGTEEGQATWGVGLWRTGGAAAGAPEPNDPETISVWWGVHRNRAPLYDWAGADLTKLDRFGDIFTLQSVIALDSRIPEASNSHPSGVPHDCLGLRSS